MHGRRPKGHPIVELNRAILATRGVELQRDAFILDFGCGSGRYTYEYLDAGYRNAFGYDVRDNVKLRADTDRVYFRFEANAATNLRRRMTQIPWPDDTFDFIFAITVFEHVLDQKRAHVEIHRVLKPGGVFLNNFPSKWRLIEPHIWVPFAGAIQSPTYFKFWANAGLRSPRQRGLSAAEVAAKNIRYAKHGIKYLSGAAIEELVSDSFDSYEFVEDAFIRNSTGKSRHLAALVRVPGFLSFYRLAHTRVILARK
jgi:SAM-dependent methyltransferase